MLAVSAGANLVSAGVALAYIRKHGGLRYIARKTGLQREGTPDYPTVAHALFDTAPLGAGDVVFFGDSHVQGAPLLELLTPYRARGIGGQTTTTLRTWVDQVVSADVARIVLLVGTNDIWLARTPAEIEGYYEDLLDDIAKARPDASVVMMAIPPWADGNPAVAPTNERLAALAGRRCIPFVDLYARLVDSDGRLDPRWAADDRHLNAAGYRQVAAAFREAGHVAG